MEISETLRELETSLLHSAVRRNSARVGELLAEEFCEIGRSGRVYSRMEILDLLADEEEIQVEMSEFVCRAVAAGVALVTYRSDRLQAGGEALVALRSSLWVLRDGRWQMLFHQGTPLLTQGRA